MANGDGGSWSNSKLAGIAGSVIVVLASAFLLFGTNQKVDELSSQVSNLEEDVEELAAISEQIDELDARLDEADIHLAELQAVRDEIVRAICQVLEEENGGTTCRLDE